MIGVMAVFYFVISTFAFIEVDAHHDGLMFKVAVDILHGAAPFSQTFTQYGLLGSLIHAGVLAITGPELSALRYVTMLFYVVTSGILYVLARLFLGRFLSVLSVLAWLAVAPFYLYPLLPWSSAVALPFQALAIITAVLHFRRQSNTLLFISAMAATAVFWIRMPLGVVTLLSYFCLFFFFALTRWRRPIVLLDTVKQVGVVVAGAAVLSVPLLAYLVYRGALADWYLQTFVMASVFAKSIPDVWGTGSSLLREVGLSFFPFWLSPLWAVLPIALLLGFLVLAYRHLFEATARDSQVARMLIAYSTFAIASWSQYYPVTEARHVFWASMPMIPLMIYWIRSACILALGWLTRRGRWFAMLPMTATLLVLVVLFLPPVLKRVEQGGGRLVVFNQKIEEPSVLAGMYDTKDNARLFAQMNQDILALQARYPGTQLITTGVDALYLTFGHYSSNWHPLYVYFDIGVAIYPGYPSNLKAYIRREKPIILSPGEIWPLSGYRDYARYANGMNLLEPKPADQSFWLPHDTTADDDMVVTNFSNLLAPMRVAGARLGSISLANESTLEMVFSPAQSENQGEILLSNMFGPNDKGSGFAIARAAEQDRYDVVVYDQENGGAVRKLLSFDADFGRCHYVAIRKQGQHLELWRDAELVDSTDLGQYDLNTSNQLIVNSGFLLRQHYNGQIRQVRVEDHALSKETILRNASFSADRCN